MLTTGRTFPDPAPSRVRLGTLVVVGAAVLGTVACGGGGTGGAGARPNVIIISADTLRSDHVGANGYERDTTPNIDRLAEEGVNFQLAYSQAPNTAPSHSSILTSMYPSVHGVFNHGQKLDDKISTLPESFGAAGYDTAAFTQLNGATYRQGFDTYETLESPFEKGKGLGDMRPVTDWLAERGEEPFFMFLHSYDVHLPLNPPQEFIDRFSPGYEGPLAGIIRRREVDAINSGELEASAADKQYIVDLYDAELFRADEIYGALFDQLRQLGLYENTVIAFFSDHGEELGEHGQWGRHSYSLYDELLRTPLILRGPGVPAATVVSDPVRLVDLAPTLLALAGIEPPDNFMGEDLGPVWAGKERQPRDVFAEKIDLQVLIAAGYKIYSDGRLFDLQEDPTEQRDLTLHEAELRGLMLLQLAEWKSRMARAAQGFETGGPSVLSAEEKKRLRDLGYL